MNVAKPSPVSKPIAPPTAELCSHCRQWLGDPEDSYCGFCGQLLVKLSISRFGPLILGMAGQRILVFSNSGSRPLRIKIATEGRPFRAVLAPCRNQKGSFRVGPEAMKLLKIRTGDKVYGCPLSR